MSHKILQFKKKNQTINTTERNKFKHQKLMQNQELIPIMVQGLHKRFLMMRLLKGLIIRLSLQLSSMLEVLLHLVLLKVLIQQHLGKILRGKS